MGLFTRSTSHTQASSQSLFCRSGTLQETSRAAHTTAIPLFILVFFFGFAFLFFSFPSSNPPLTPSINDTNPHSTLTPEPSPLIPHQFNPHHHQRHPIHPSIHPPPKNTHKPPHSLANNPLNPAKPSSTPSQTRNTNSAGGTSPSPRIPISLASARNRPSAASAASVPRGTRM